MSAAFPFTPPLRSHTIISDDDEAPEDVLVCPRCGRHTTRAAVSAGLTHVCSSAASRRSQPADVSPPPPPPPPPLHHYYYYSYPGESAADEAEDGESSFGDVSLHSLSLSRSEYASLSPLSTSSSSPSPRHRAHARLGESFDDQPEAEAADSVSSVIYLSCLFIYL